MKNFICVYDFETDGKDPNVCEPVQLAALMLNPHTLEVVDDSEFCTDMRPVDIDHEGYYEKHLDTIQWHAKNYSTEKNPVTADHIFEKWQNAPDQKSSWNKFVTYLLRYNMNQARRTKYDAPVRAGANIVGFDDIITTRLCGRYGQLTKDGEPKIFHQRDYVELNQLCFYWFFAGHGPDSYSMDSLRDYFGIPQEGGHDALKDVRDEGWLISKILGLHRHFAPKITFKDAYKRKTW